MKVGFSLIGLVFGKIFPEGKLVNVVGENKNGEPLTSALSPANLNNGNNEAKVVYGKPTISIK